MVDTSTNHLKRGEISFPPPHELISQRSGFSSEHPYKRLKRASRSSPACAPPVGATLISQTSSCHHMGADKEGLSRMAIPRSPSHLSQDVTSLTKEQLKGYLTSTIAQLGLDFTKLFDQYESVETKHLQFRRISEENLEKAERRAALAERRAAEAEKALEEMAWEASVLREQLKGKETIELEMTELRCTQSRLIAEHEAELKATVQKLNSLQDHIMEVWRADHNKTWNKVRAHHGDLDYSAAADSKEGVSALAPNEATTAPENAKLEEKEEEIEYLKTMNQALIVKERKTNDELQEARRELISAFRQMSSRTIVGVKRMGELNSKPFLDACKQKYSSEEANEKSAELCSLWEDYLRDPAWHPFKIIDVGNAHQEVIDEEDEKLKILKCFGGGVYNAVITVLMELNEYNPSGRTITEELWNSKERTRATLTDGIKCILRQMKRKRRFTY